VPEGWEPAGEDRLGRGLEIAVQVLVDPGVVDDLARYYHRDGNYAGATFLDVEPQDPYAVTSGDLLALTMLSVQAEPQSVRRMLELTSTNREMRQLLTEEAMPLDADLAVADDSTLIAMAHLHEACKRALSLTTVAKPNPWVTASKLCARKRPDLFPVRDSVVCDLLGLSGSKQNYEVDWQVYRRIVQDDEIRGRLDYVVDEASGREGVNIGHPNRRLRHLDVALWMHAQRRQRDV
jgi:hypothetical protein